MITSATLETALERLDYLIEPLNETVNVPIEAALGLVSAGDVRTTTAVPPFDRSSMDGYAMRGADTLGATADNPARLRVVGAVYAGSVLGRELGPGEAVSIMTGAAMPAGADCMLPKEIVTVDSGWALIPRPARKHENYIFSGEDIKVGEVFIKPFTKLDFAHLAMLAAAGLERITVFRQPNIGVFCVGEEFSPAGGPLAEGKIYNSNGIMLNARLAELGFATSPHRILPDDPGPSARIIAGTAGALDIIISTGSVSVGDKDIMGRVFGLLGAELDVHRLAFKPGHAFMCGRHGRKPMFCLSGNPFAALATFELLVRPALARLAHRPDLTLTRAKAVLQTPFSGGKGGSSPRRFLRARLVLPTEARLPEVFLPDDHSSGRLFSLPGCNCLVDMKEGLKGLAVGDIVEIVKLGLTNQ
ncbi:MAG: molybdopterin molybdotransferase MoeA [Deltaproteobacteria bacterium]|jgi:molybdopterin molybdotransferase|nr:molybdopterin molybdotransferase MoeA [Deltaproteobacteria bacterium]